MLPRRLLRLGQQNDTGSILSDIIIMMIFSVATLLLLFLVSPYLC